MTINPDQKFREAGSRWDPADDEIHDVRPYDFAGGKRATARASRDQADASQWRAGTLSDAAAAERAYRVGLAEEITRLHTEEGVAWTVCGDLARGAKHVADLRYARDVAQGLAEAAEINAWKCNANRKSLDELLRWSMKVAPLGQEREPEQLERPIGAIAA
jgi:hypothetical protein